MKKRNLVVKLIELPGRAVQLSEDSMANIFGGCIQENGWCIFCDCCDGLKCITIRNQYGLIENYVCKKIINFLRLCVINNKKIWFEFALLFFLRNIIMKKRKRDLVVQFIDLPARAVQLSEDRMVNIFGGCKGKGHGCELCDCCDGLKCIFIDNSSGGTRMCK